MLKHDDVALARALERCEVPNEGFPHASHLRVAWVYLNESTSLDHAVTCMAATLRRFAASVGHANKYSEATTVFWMLQVAAARAVMPMKSVIMMMASATRTFWALRTSGGLNAVTPSDTASKLSI